MPAIDDTVGELHHSTKPDQGLIVNLIAAEQLGVVTEVAQEPAELPQRFRGAVEPCGEGAPDPGRGCENGWSPSAVPMGADVRGKTRGRCSTGCCGCWAQERNGASCRSGIHRIRPAIAAFSSGCEKGCWRGRCACWLQSCRDRAGWTWRKPSSTPRLLPRKRGPCCRPHQTRQGHEDRRCRRCSRSSSRRQCAERFAAREPTRRRSPEPELPRPVARATDW